MDNKQQQQHKHCLSKQQLAFDSQSFGKPIVDCRRQPIDRTLAAGFRQQFNELLTTNAGADANNHSSNCITQQQALQRRMQQQLHQQHYFVAKTNSRQQLECLDVSPALNYYNKCNNNTSSVNSLINNISSKQQSAESLRAAADEDDANYASNLRSKELEYRRQLQLHQLNAMSRSMQLPTLAHQQQKPPPQRDVLQLQGYSQDKHNSNSNSNSNNNNNNASNDIKHQIQGFACAKSEQQSSQQQQRKHSVNFGDRRQQASGNSDCTDDGDRHKKYLTAKYGQHQMSLIKKRLKIEMWMHDELLALARRLESVGSAVQADAASVADEIEIDLDELLDLADDEARIESLRETLKPLYDMQPDNGRCVDEFIEAILEQAKLL